MDLDSAAGTRVLGVWLAPNEPQQLVPGDRLWLGGIEMGLVSSASPPPAMVRNFEPRDPLSGDEDDPPSPTWNGADPPQAFRVKTLTCAERGVLLWLCRGYTCDQEIARALCRSEHTVRTHMANIFQKLGLHSRAELIGWVRRAELADSESPCP